MNNKKIFFTIAFLLAAFTMNAETPWISDQQYDNENDFIVETVGDGFVARITGYNGTKTEVRIPRGIRKMTVVAIGEGAFNKKGFTGVTIPNTVILIGSKAFFENKITKITIGTNVMLHEDSFDSRFAGFYFDNGRRAGTYILNNGAWAIQTMTNSPQDDEDIPDESSATAESSEKFGVEPYAGFSVGIGLWDYGPSSLIPRVGLHLGLLTNISSFKIGLVGEGGGFFGFAYPFFEDVGISYGYYFGSFIEFYFSDLWAFSLGGGMTKGYFTTRNDLGEDYFLPFMEFNVMLGDEDDSTGIFFRYYFNDSDKFYNKFSVGIKRREF